jgi:hypothetical protein
MQNKLRRSLCAVARGGALIALIPVISATSGAASAEEKEPVAVLELGGAGSWDVRGAASFGPSAAVEFEPIKNYLMIEAGLTPFFDTRGHADWDFDLLFRHSFDLSKKVEFEPGFGPTWSSSGQVGAQASFEFMIWPWQERKFGWFVDPSYSVSFAPGHQQSVGLTLGILIGFLPQAGRLQ